MCNLVLFITVITFALCLEICYCFVVVVIVVSLFMRLLKPKCHCTCSGEVMSVNANTPVAYATTLAAARPS